MTMSEEEVGRLVDQFYADGYLIVKDAYADETVDALQASWPWPSHGFTAETLTGGRLFGTLTSKRASSLLPESYRKSPVVMALVREMFRRGGTRYDERHFGFVNAVPGTEAQRWHRDDGDVIVDDRLRYLLVLTPLAHVEKAMGFPEILVSSHTARTRDMAVTDGDVVCTAELQPRDALFLSGSVVHRGTPNTTDKERVLLWTRFTSFV